MNALDSTFSKEQFLISLLLSCSIGDVLFTIRYFEGSVELSMNTYSICSATAILELPNAALERGSRECSEPRFDRKVL